MRLSPRLARFVCSLLAGLSLLALPLAAHAERPPAPKLLPENTLAMFRAADTQDLIARFRETSMGRMARDPQMAPLVENLYKSVNEAYQQIEERVGVPLDKILKIPQGEICLGVIPQGESGPPAVIFLMDVKDQVRSVQTLLEKGEQLLTENGGSKTTEIEGDVKLNIYTGQGGNSVVLFEKEGTYVITTNKDLVKPLLKAWSGDTQDKSLADNAKFNSIMSRCSGSKDDRPQLTFYIDPVEIARRLLRESPASLALAFFPALGVDGIQGIGGSMTFNSGEFDGIQHIHILLDNPRKGLVELVALGSGDTTPEAWVANDVTNYMTLHLRVEDMHKSGSMLWDSLQGEGDFSNIIRTRLSDNLGIDVEKDLIPALDGRITLTNWIEKPARLNSQTNIVGIKLKDAKAFQATLDKIIEKFSENFEKKSYGGISYWKAILPEPNNERPANIRIPEPSIAILGDYLILTDSTQALQHCINTTGDSSRSLANDLEYKLIAAKIKRQVGGDAPAMVQYTRPEESLRLMYDLATGEDAKRVLASGAENNPFVKSVDKALKDNPLPPFSVLAKYLAPGGGMLVNDETGIHYMQFGLKRQSQ